MYIGYCSIFLLCIHLSIVLNQDLKIIKIEFYFVSITLIISKTSVVKRDADSLET